MRSTLALLALPLLGLAGCIVDNNASVRVHSICAPPDDAAACVFADTCDAETIGPNVLDVSLTNFLWTPIQVDNQRPDNGDLNVQRVNTSTAWVQEYEVEYEGVALPIARGPILGSAVVPADGSAVISVLPINEATGNLLAGALPAGGAVDLVAKLKIAGVYGDTSTFESGVFEVPIRVCSGCIGGYPACPTAGDVRFFCPPNPGQQPLATVCSTP